MEHKDRTVTVAIITGVVALLLGCCLGAMAGAMGGYFIGHQASSRWNERIAPDSFEMPTLPDLAGMQGALVQEVVAGSPAEAAGVQVGDIITAVDGTPIDANHRLADVVSQYQPGDRVKITVWRAGDAKSHHSDTRRKSAGQYPPLSGSALRRLPGPAGECRAERLSTQRGNERSRQNVSGGTFLLSSLATRYLLERLTRQPRSGAPSSPRRWHA